ncbi:leucine zipper domain-containing protein [Streptomyces sp. NPDC048737]|uniref:helix-turn-helix domain-containing protein n=1 Tax=Streptomyces sp. NPDC048737 TaxID=3155764 RepID=UPI0034309967
MSRRHARLAVHGRRLPVARVRSGRPVAHVAAERGIPRATAHQWIRRRCGEGEAGLLDRSGRPDGCDRAVPSSRVTTSRAGRPSRSPPDREEDRVHRPAVPQGGLPLVVLGPKNAGELLQLVPEVAGHPVRDRAVGVRRRLGPFEGQAAYLRGAVDGVRDAERDLPGRTGVQEGAREQLRGNAEAAQFVVQQAEEPARAREDTQVVRVAGMVVDDVLQGAVVRVARVHGVRVGAARQEVVQGLGDRESVVDALAVQVALVLSTPRITTGR